MPATLAARMRVLASGRSTKNDPDDAVSVAVASLRVPALRATITQIDGRSIAQASARQFSPLLRTTLVLQQLL